MGLRFKRGSQEAAQQKLAQSDHILSACTEHDVSFLAKGLIDMGPTVEQFDDMMSAVQGVQDRCAAFAMGDSKLGKELANTFLQKMVVEADWAGAVGALLTDASAVAAGEEIDHHPPDQGPGAGAFNPHDFYK